MSTRATIHFHEVGESKPTAIIYRHGDGYPENIGLGGDLQRFLKELKANVKDNRLTDAGYLAAKWVVWDADNMRKMTAGINGVIKGKEEEPRHICDFLSVGIYDADPGDIEYRYKVVADGKPTITCEHGWGDKWKKCKIPKLAETTQETV